MGKAERVSSSFPREARARRREARHRVRAGAGLRSLSPGLCSAQPACKSLRLIPRPRHSLCVWTGRIRSSSESVWSPVYSLCSTQCKETRDNIPMFFYSGGRILLFGHDPCLGLDLLVIILNLSPMMNTLVEKLRKS